ncbi:unnamed protein product [Symbiodinium necroappetens]|uniref:E3 ubiquitin-protein ligase HERC2 n=1 Tax=Symbiodinium necroappetens TaxID=1628268 RepID=A0A813AD12_9DINO|nr:unnamed protein product [Symbiodinium necroappetens]
MDSSGAALDPSSTVKRTRLQPGDSVTLQIRPPVVQATSQAWAAILDDGSVVTWGNPSYGGDSGWAEPDLRNVVKIQSNPWAFAAILHDGSVVAWGDLDKGGSIGQRLTGVRDIQASARAFAAILNDGSVEAWGDEDGGGFLSEDIVDCHLVRGIQWNCRAFAAILDSGSVVTWGDAAYGGECNTGHLRGVVAIEATISAFATEGGDSSRVQAQLRNVVSIAADTRSFTAILSNGSLVAWGAV